MWRGQWGMELGKGICFVPLGLSPIKPVYTPVRAFRLGTDVLVGWQGRLGDEGKGP